MKINFQKKLRARHGLTLVEMMVATSILVVMMLGLTAMFNQTQRAFRSGLKQVDVFESGRAVADLLARDFNSLADSEVPGVVNLYHGYDPVNDLIQPNGSIIRTNQLEFLFLLSHANNQWDGIGYTFITNSGVPGVATLYRFTVSTNAERVSNNLYKLYGKAVADVLLGTAPTNFNRVAEGIIHFKVRTLNAQGIELAPLPTDYYGLPLNTFLQFKAGMTFTNGTMISTNGIPNTVEVEIGILEPQTWEQAKSVGNPQAFLQKQAGKVHIFRQQIPIRNASR